MKHVVSCRLMGGLGNYMFQISTAYSLSLRDGKEFICDYSDSTVPQKPYHTYTDNIFRKINFTDKLPSFVSFHEYGTEYNEIPKIDDNVKIFGYFGSEKYFKNYRNEILDLFEIDEKNKDELNEKYLDLINHPNSCSIHVRRGDYLNLQDYHKVQSIDYYINAYNEMGHDKKYLIFSDDLEWCKENFDFIENKVIIEGNTDYQDLYLMSLCKNNIICNSTFSWWGAWLNKNMDKKVIMPKNWFGTVYSHLSINDVICNEWVVI
jgi:hypothetical protein